MKSFLPVRIFVSVFLRCFWLSDATKSLFFLCIFNSKKRVKKLVEIWETYMVRSNNYTERKGVLFCCIMLKEV